MFSAKTFSRRRRTSAPAKAVERRLTLERLEEREVPAGIVSVFATQSNFAGTVNLVITGDDLDNQVDIVRESGQVKIIAQGTTVLHYDLSSTPGVSVTPTYTQITFNASGGIRDISITMGGGHDAVRVSAIGDHSFGNFGVNLGSGNDSFLLLGSSSTSPNINFVNSFSLDSDSGDDLVSVYKTALSGGTLSTGDGNDTVYLNDCVGGPISTSLGAGNDTLLVNSCRSDSFSADLGSGNDRASFSGNNRFGGLIGRTWFGGLTVVGGAGNDLLTFTGQTQVLNKLNIDLGVGNDRLLVAAAANSSDPATLSVDGPDGEINALIRLGTGNDLVRFGTGSGSGPSVNFADQTRLEMGSGDDALFIRNAIFNLLIALLGDGTDRVLNDWGGSGVTVGAGSKLHGGVGVDLLPSGWTTPPNLTILAIP
ncbi:hypothetical protein [Thermogemmata fonticola]|uniref:Calcium-binding protein n=1 Tax=Thermogemmata fonticola TaxID=2755323 RepID=A0A7V8VBF4_9BACT|nr:hypothetical protein [Thermogemmata fonticola]MBA2224955.1 hypothetical protein [Thermogemmata fonticola]